MDAKLWLTKSKASIPFYMCLLWVMLGSACTAKNAM